MLEMLMPLVIAALAGALVMPVMQALKKVSAFVDGLPVWMKRFVVAVLALVAVKVAALSGVPVPDDILHMDGTTVEALMTWLVSMAIHAVYKKGTE